MADTTVITVYPEYLISITINRYDKIDVVPRQAVRHLYLLRDHFKAQLVTAEGKS